MDLTNLLIVFKGQTLVIRTLLYLCLSLGVVHGQVRNELLWAPTLHDDSEEEYRQNYARIVKAGFKLDLEALSQGDVVASFTTLSTLTSNIPGSSDGISFNYNDQNGNVKQAFISRVDIHKQLKEWLEIYLDDMLTRIRIRGSVEDYKQKERKEFQLVLKGKKLGVKWKSYSWPIEIGKVQDLNKQSPYSLSFICKNVPYASVEFDSLYSDITAGFPQLDNEVCEPFDRFTYHKKYFGLNDEGMSYRPYRPKSGISRKKNFRLYFDKASTSYNRKEINDIIKYLNDSNLMIRTAKVLAFASVEGDSAINMRLQEERAMVLMETLEKANNDTIEITLQTREDWSLFNSQLSKTPFQNRYSQEEWKELFENDSIEARFEKYLSKQRRAELFLSLTQRLTDEQKVTVAFGDFNKTVESYNPNARHDQHWNLIRRVFSIKKYLEIQAMRGMVDKEHVCTLFPPSINEFHVVMLYETARIMRNGQLPVCENLKDIILAAHFAVLDLIQTYGKNRLYIQQALDVQSFAYEMVAKGEVSNSILCQLDYPDQPYFYNLILNKLFFQEHQGRDSFDDLPCLESYLDTEIPPQQFFTSIADPILDSDDKPKSNYYYVLKKIVLENNEYVKKLVLRSDHVIQFDIFEFLFYNLNNWSVWDGKLFDEEVTPEIMAQQLQRLRSMKALICPNQMNSLTLLFHLKVMQSSVYNAQATDLTSQSIDYISHYYQEHAAKMNDRLALIIAKQIMAMTPLYYRNEPAHEAYDVLRLKDWKEPLKGEALNYYLNLVNLIAKDRNERMAVLKAKYREGVWDSFFTGKYSIPQNSSYR